MGRQNLSSASPSPAGSLASRPAPRNYLQINNLSSTLRPTPTPPRCRPRTLHLLKSSGSLLPLVARRHRKDPRRRAALATAAITARTGKARPPRRRGFKNTSTAAKSISCIYAINKLLQASRRLLLSKLHKRRCKRLALQLSPQLIARSSTSPPPEPSSLTVEASASSKAPPCSSSLRHCDPAGSL